MKNKETEECEEEEDKSVRHSETQDIGRTYFRSVVQISAFSINIARTGAHPRGGGEGEVATGQPLQTPQNRNFKNTGFVNTVILNLLRDLPFRQNQPLKSVNDYE
jgi:hypothetical protein